MEIFLCLKKNSVEIRLIFEKKKKKSKKILKIIFAICLFLKKKSVKTRRLIHQSKDQKLSVKMSVNLGYFRLKHRLHNLPGMLVRALSSNYPSDYHNKIIFIISSHSWSSSWKTYPHVLFLDRRFYRSLLFFFNPILSPLPRPCSLAQVHTRVRASCWSSSSVVGRARIQKCGTALCSVE